jgi:hypothetical protein
MCKYMGTYIDINYNQALLDDYKATKELEVL